MASTRRLYSRSLAAATLVVLFWAVHPLVAQEEFDANRVCKDLPDHEQLTGILRRLSRIPWGTVDWETTCGPPSSTGTAWFALSHSRAKTGAASGRKPGDLGSESHYRQCLQPSPRSRRSPAGPGAVDGQSLCHGAAGRQFLRAAVQPSGRSPGRLSRQPQKTTVSPRTRWSGAGWEASTSPEGVWSLYDNQGDLLGGLGVSGDTSCTDHVVAWKVRGRPGSRPRAGRHQPHRGRQHHL